MALSEPRFSDQASAVTFPHSLVICIDFCRGCLCGCSVQRRDPAVLLRYNRSASRRCEVKPYPIGSVRMKYPKLPTSEMPTRRKIEEGWSVPCKWYVPNHECKGEIPHFSLGRTLNDSLASATHKYLSM
jgi:hypothetical protein